MTSLPPEDTPPDLMFMLGKIDGKLDTLIKRGDEHEIRIVKIEQDLGDRPQYKKRFDHLERRVDEHGDALLGIATTTANFKLVAIVLWALFGVALAAAVAKAFHFA